jgi:SsrA-binding protein
MAEKVIATNKRAFHDFYILETFEAGIVLLGSEVKSCRQNQVNLKDSYGRIKDGEIYLIDAHISPYFYSHQLNHDPLRDRKLLFHKQEIKRFYGKMRERGQTLIPLKMYFKNGKVKVEMALAKGKKTFDRREDIKKRDMEREIRKGFKEKKRGSCQ